MGSSRLKDQSYASAFSCIAGRFFTDEAPEELKKNAYQYWNSKATYIQV